MCVVWHELPQQLGVAHAHPPVFAFAVLQSENPGAQVYWQADPEQLTLVAFVGEHTSPNALQLLVVVRSVQVLPQVVSPQVQLPALQSGVGWAHAVPFTQRPVAPQVCGMFPLQLTWPGAQEPEQTPLTHVWFVHPRRVPQAPLALHCW